MPLAPGDVFAGYTVLRQIGSGGMGEVYLVRHPRLPRRDALKLLNRELSSEPDFVARFMREADVVAALSHRNIVSIYDRGEEKGQLWLTMRYVDGIDCEAALEQAGGIFPAARAVHIVGEVAGALDAAHRQNLIHRDVKPANILLCESGDDDPELVFLTDFGIAKSLDAGSRLTRTGLVVATFDYASPEQIEARTLDSRSDVYSLGCVLYKLLTGSVPYPGETMLAPAAGHLSLPAPKPTALAPWLAPALDDVVGRAMAKNPADRYPTCRALAAAAAAAMDAFPEVPRPPYRVFLSRTVNVAGSGQHLGPMRTDRLSEQETEQLVGLVRRTRFFDLPEQMGAGAPPQRQVTIEIGCTGRAHRVVADLGTAHRPPELDELVSVIETMSITPAAPAVTERQAAPPRRDAPPVPRIPQPVTGGRFAQPPPPLPPAPVPLPERDRAGTPAVEHPRPRSAPQPVVQRSDGYPPVQSPGQPPFPSPVQAPGPRPDWTPPPPPGRFEPLWQPPQDPSGGHRTRNTLIALLVAVLVAGGATAWLLFRPDAGGSGTDDGSDGGSGPSTSQPAKTTTATPQAQAAWAALPTSAALGAGTFVTAVEVGDGDWDLFKIDAASGTGLKVTQSPDLDSGPLLSPDRNNVIYVRKYVDGRVELRTVAPAGNGDRALFDRQPLGDCAFPGRPAWNSADPTQLAIACYDNANLEVVRSLRVVTLDGVTIQNLTPPTKHVDDLTFSPDGSRIAYWGHNDVQAKAGNIYIQPVDGTSAVLRTRTGTDSDPVWSPDGRAIAYSHGVGSRGRAREIWVLSPDDDSDPRSLLASTGYSDQGPSWSQDGSMLAFKSNRSGSDQVWVMAADGTDPKQVTRDGEAASSPAWGNR